MVQSTPEREGRKNERKKETRGVTTGSNSSSRIQNKPRDEKYNKNEDRPDKIETKHCKADDADAHLKQAPLQQAACVAAAAQRVEVPAAGFVLLSVHQVNAAVIPSRRLPPRQDKTRHGFGSKSRWGEGEMQGRTENGRIETSVEGIGREEEGVCCGVMSYHGMSC